MRRLSKRTQALVWQIRPPSNIVRSMPADEAELISKIGASGEVAAVLALMWPLMESIMNDHVAANSIAQLLAAASPDELLELEEDVRGKSSWDLPVSWSQLTVQNVLPFRSKLESQAAALGLLSWHPSGRVHEYACRELATRQESSIPAFLLPRMNDWVEPIRRIARESLEHLVDAGRGSDLLGHLYLVFRLLDCQRGDHRPFVNRVVEELVAPRNGIKLDASLKCSLKSVRRTSYRLAIHIEGSHRLAMIQACLHSDDPVLRELLSNLVDEG